MGNNIYIRFVRYALVALILLFLSVSHQSVWAKISLNMGNLGLVSFYAKQHDGLERTRAYITYAYDHNEQRAIYALALLEILEHGEVYTSTARLINDPSWLLHQGIRDIYGRNPSLCREKCLKRVLEIDPRNSTAWFFLGRSVHIKGESLLAIQYYIESATHNRYEKQFTETYTRSWYGPESANLASTLRYQWLAYMDIRNWSDAELIARQLIELNTELAEGWFFLGQTLYSAKQVEAAVTAFEKAVRLRGNFEEYLFLGRAYRDLGEIDRAIGAYEQSVQQRSRDAVLRELAQIHINHTGDLAKAAELLQQYALQLPNRCSEALQYWVHTSEMMLKISEQDNACNLLSNIIAMQCSLDQAERLYNQYCEY